jgi:hypothetical protein
MSNVIPFLEAMGRNATMSRMSIADYQAAVATLDVDETLRAILLRRDAAALGRALCARETLLCMIFAPEKEEPAPQEDRPEGTPGAAERA